MQFRDLLVAKGFDPDCVLVMRHQPDERALNRVLRWLAAEQPEIYNGYQQAQRPRSEKALARAKYLASFVSNGPGKALFVGLYKNTGSKPLSYDQYWQVPANIELQKYGMRGLGPDEGPRLWFDLMLVDFYADWKGRLVITWPRPDRNWFRWASSPKSEMPICAIAEESALDAEMDSWDELTLTWSELNTLPARWRTIISQWRGIYFIFDRSDGKGYVGSAYGAENIMGRWLNYATSGHGGNKLRKQRNRENFVFSVLQRLSPDTAADDVIRLENAWKKRLHSREFGLNEN
jgi:hypothetical protein